jgi:hypothetical protein
LLALLLLEFPLQSGTSQDSRITKPGKRYWFNRDKERSIIEQTNDTNSRVPVI